MAQRHSTLTGSWSGACRYPEDRGPEAVFEAHLEETGARLIGWVREPDLGFATEDPVLHAQIDGTRTHQAVTFTKIYNHEGMAHAIHYDGVINADFTRIDGRWTVNTDWSGTFFMTREDVAGGPRS